jgi:hypothetical protein
MRLSPASRVGPYEIEGTGCDSLAVLVSTGRTVLAQSKTLTGDSKTVTATVEAIEASSRTVTLKKPDGTYVSVVAGPEVKRFSELKLGDTVTAKYYDNVVIRLKKPGEPDVNPAAKATTPSGQASPGGTKATQRTITATITAIDPAMPAITFTGPNGWKYSSKVEDKEALAKVKVGDKVDITWTRGTADLRRARQVSRCFGAGAIARGRPGHHPLCNVVEPILALSRAGLARGRLAGHVEPADNSLPTQRTRALIRPPCSSVPYTPQTIPGGSPTRMESGIGG